MSVININNIPVNFPYQPYQAQVDFMGKVIESIETRQYALLESPTGTGKTLSLLCSALSWRKATNTEVQIVYASRTHSQLSNVIKELKKTVFHPSVSHIASRSHLCLNETVQKKSPSEQQRMCAHLRRIKACIYGDDQQIVSSAEKITSGCLNLEEFRNECERLRVCPYFTAQIGSKTASMILTPYTYIVDPIVSSCIPLESMRESIMILDEAHNFPDQCSDNMSIDLPFYVLQKAIQAITKVHDENFSNTLNKGQTKLDIHKVGSARQFLQKVCYQFLTLDQRDPDIAKLYSEKDPNDRCYKAIQRDAKYLFDIFQRANVSVLDMYLTRSTVDDIIRQSMYFQNDEEEMKCLESISFFLTILFEKSQVDMDENLKYIESCYTICFTNQPAVSLLCFSPSIGFMNIVDTKQPRTVILASGTLSPMDEFAKELDPSNKLFKIRLENSHIAKSNQVFVGIVGKGINNHNFHFVYTNRNNKDLKKDCIESLNSIFNIVPAGVLTFFPSFSFLEDYSGMIKIQKNKKKLFIEPRNSKELDNTLHEYQKNAARGASLLAVCRGKMSEGMDFADDFARCVCVIGIPYPNKTDYHVEFRMNWLDSKQPGSGSKWYLISALRAVNQAIGRAIRHKDDYAAILLFDDRYNGLKGYLSKWIRPSIHNITSWENLIIELESFYFEKENPIFINNKMLKDSTKQNNVQSQQSKKLKESNTNKKINNLISQQDIPITKRVVEKSRPLLLHPPHIKEMKSKPTPIDMQKGLSSLFNLSKTESQNSKTTKNNKDGKSLIESLLTVTNKEEKVCAACNKKEARMKRQKCGHYICSECYDFMSALKMKCPKCNQTLK